MSWWCGSCGTRSSNRVPPLKEIVCTLKDNFIGGGGDGGQMVDEGEVEEDGVNVDRVSVMCALSTVFECDPFKDEESGDDGNVKKSAFPVCLCFECAKALTTLYNGFKEFIQLVKEGGEVGRKLKELRRCQAKDKLAEGRSGSSFAETKKVKRVREGGRKHRKKGDEKNKPTPEVCGQFIQEERTESLSENLEVLINEEPQASIWSEQEQSDVRMDEDVLLYEDARDDGFERNDDQCSTTVTSTPTESVRRSTRLKKSAKYESEEEDDYHLSSSDLDDSASDDGDNNSGCSTLDDNKTVTKIARKPHISSSIKFTPNKSGKYPCPRGKSCCKIFVNKKSCIRHFQVTHIASSTVQCPTCSKQFTRQDDLLKHNRTVHGEVISRGASNDTPILQRKGRKYPCPVCSIPLFKTELGPHLSQHSDPTPYSCSKCSLRFETRELLSKHKDVHYIRKKATCIVCGHIFRDTGHLSQHQVKIHHVRTDKVKANDIKEMASTESEGVSRPHSCHICAKSYLRNDELADHLLSHGTGEKLKCTVCGAEFSNKNSLSRHELTHTDPEYKCLEEGCGREFTRKDYLVQHLKTVHGVEKAKRILKDKTVVCEVCKKIVSSKRLKLHMVVHTGEKTHLCDTCGRSFSLHSSLTVHRNYVHGLKKSLVCDECGVTCKRPKDLRAHKQIKHELPDDHRPYHCSMCEKSFKWAKGLKDHEALHRGERQCACDLCGKVFTRPDSLRVHLRTVHDGQELRRKKARIAKNKDSKSVDGGTAGSDDHRHYHCSLCEKSFKRARGLRDHEALHRGERQCACDRCGKVFTRPDSLRVHVRTVHDGQKPRRKKVRMAKKKNSTSEDGESQGDPDYFPNLMRL